jgi:hypothetical protein
VVASARSMFLTATFLIISVLRFVPYAQNPVARRSGVRQWHFYGYGGIFTHPFRPHFSGHDPDSPHPVDGVTR